MKIILIGNYPPDRQESMERFARMLYNGFVAANIASEIWTPVVFFGRLSKSTIAGYGKWLGYIDKWILFPVLLWLKVKAGRAGSNNIHFHVCDHSNAFYLKQLPKERTAITCHDVLAIRGALGHADAFCEASSFGKILQKWILGNLVKARRLATVSQFTLDQLNELAAGKPGSSKDWRVIYNGFNAPFQIMETEEAMYLAEKAGIRAGDDFALHVGSSLPRKNRKMLLEMAARLGDTWKGKICFAGEALEEALVSRADVLGLTNRVVAVERPDHHTLVALYSLCKVFVFPSFSEGFGWPVIEAQACGAPVLASVLAPMPEIAGGGALHANPNDPAAFANAFASFEDNILRADLIRLGHENCERFDLAKMINDYLSLHGITKG